ncbi:MAG TPA: glycine oxidase ThiO [Chloroflexota bacterium]|nr:glycine oxidase ThiO [Chloroflexota bacterium]HZU05664.1 glycine oxidase ThiO [Chloroflexota bacterium]
MSRAGVAPDVAIVGGGVIGCAAAYYLARAGARVVVLERDRIGAEASTAAAGLLAPLAEDARPGPFLDLALASLARYPALATELRATTGIDIELLTPGLLRLALDEAEAADYQASLRWQQQRGLPVRWLEGAEVRTLVPQVTSSVCGAVYSELEHHVNPVRLVEALARAAAAHGAEFRLGTPVQGLCWQGRRVVGVRLPEGELAAGHVVLAAGAWAAACGDWLGIRLPVEPVKGQLVAILPETTTLRHPLYGRRGYLVPKADGTVYVGATVERVGFDRRVTAAGVASLLGLLCELVPPLSTATFVRAWAGLRPGTPDHLPVLGPVPGIEGVTLATGHYRNGILLAPISGELVAQAAQGKPTTLPLAPFSPARFAGAAAAPGGTP